MGNKGEASPHAKLTAAQVWMLRHVYRLSIECYPHTREVVRERLAEIVGVSAKTVDTIVRNLSWKKPCRSMTWDEWEQENIGRVQDMTWEQLEKENGRCRA